MSRSRVVTPISDAQLYGGFGPKPAVPHIDRRNTYYDDGTSITMQLKELVGGIGTYPAFFEQGNHSGRTHFMLQIDGEDFAVVKPFNQAVGNQPVFNVTDSAPLKTSKRIFEKACSNPNEPLVLMSAGKPFGLLTPYVEFVPE